MKNFINYYYNFNISNIHRYNGKYFFTYDNSYYMFRPCEEIIYDIDNLSKLTNELRKTNLYYHQFIYNKEQKLVTFFENRPYVLLKSNVNPQMTISIFDIKGNDYTKINKENKSLNRFDWIFLWEKKIDYFEKIFFNQKKRYHTILESFNYFVGMAENAILYVREAMMNEKMEEFDQLVVSRKRFNKNMTLVDFYDPTNLIIDHKSRDIAEYIKCYFWTDEYDIKLIEDYFNYVNLSNLGAHLLFGRLLFPSFYFDALEELLITGNYNSIYSIESRIDEYEKYISEIYQILKTHYNIHEINWIIKKMRIIHSHF